jgi:hypothetical protein
MVRALTEARVRVPSKVARNIKSLKSADRESEKTVLQTVSCPPFIPFTAAVPMSILVNGA